MIHKCVLVDLLDHSIFISNLHMGTVRNYIPCTYYLAIAHFLDRDLAAKDLRLIVLKAGLKGLHQDLLIKLRLLCHHTP
jgi:hypothetical protein